MSRLYVLEQHPVELRELVAVQLVGTVYEELLTILILLLRAGERSCRVGVELVDFIRADSLLK